MDRKLVGSAWCFGGLLDVDWELCPRSSKEELRTRGGKITDEDYGRYCMQVVDPTFVERVQRGDFIVGEEGVGYGHDHDHASRAIKGCGVAAVLCESSSPYFLRMSINAGLLVLEIPGIFAATTTGDQLEVDLDAGVVMNRTTGWSTKFEKLPDFVLSIVEGGGVYAMIENSVAAKKLAETKA